MYNAIPILQNSDDFCESFVHFQSGVIHESLRYLPSNTTPLFHPLDVGINKIFKERVYKIINSEGNRNKKNYRQVLIDAVSYVLTTINCETVKKAFAMAGFDDFKASLYDELGLDHPMTTIMKAVTKVSINKKDDFVDC